MGTRNGQWYTVTCAGNGVTGDRIELRTTQSTYLSISGIEVWTGAPGSSTIVSSGTSQQIKLSNPSMNKVYSTGAYHASWALSGGKQTAITQRGVGNWWKASFGGQYTVDKVRIKNRVDCCGERLTSTRVTVGGKLCGFLPVTTKTA